MTDGILKEVLQLEQQIEAELAREQKQAESWLAEACLTIDRELSGEQTENDRNDEQRELDALKMARNQAVQKLRHERYRARTLIDMPNDNLLPLLLDRLQVVMNGRNDDRPDDQS